MNKQIKLALIGMFALMFLVVTVSAANEFWACFDKGQKVDFCTTPSYNKPDETCTDDMGCQYCMSVYDSAKNCYIHGSYPKCLQLTPACNVIGGNGSSLDTTPPVITINKPVLNFIYNERRVAFDIQTDELTDIYWTDAETGRGKWSRMCSDCSNYDKLLSMPEGINKITVRARDSRGNLAYKNITFTVDYNKPKISKTFPKKGFADGYFEVEFKEDNVKEVVLHYGNAQKGMKTKTVGSSECLEDNGRKKCITFVDLKSYDGTEIQYWFSVKDVANNSAESKVLLLTVDTTAPKINALSVTVDKRYANFFFNVTELNFDEITYLDPNERRPKEKRLCTRLKDGICEKKVSGREGYYEWIITVRDEAGNSVARNVQFTLG